MPLTQKSSTATVPRNRRGAAAPPADTRRDRVRLVDADPDLADCIPAEDVEVARVALPALTCERGPLRGPVSGDAAPFGLLVLDGTLLRTLTRGTRRSASLCGPGDVIDLSGDGERDGPQWTAVSRVHLAVLGENFALAMRRWPQTAARHFARLARQADRLREEVAISHVSPVDQRLLAMLWHLAERWGHVTPAGVAVRLDLTHEAIGRLIGARRSTVTLAVAALQHAGSATRLADGRWLLTAPVAPDDGDGITGELAVL